MQKGENERRWPTIWLPRGDNGRDGAPRSAGLSGGWRGFALDHVSPLSSSCLQQRTQIERKRQESLYPHFAKDTEQAKNRVCFLLHL